MFLEALALDEDIYENGEYSSTIEDNKRKLLTLMCELDVLINNLGTQLEVHVLRDVMNDDDRYTATRSDRHIRDYVILKDTFQLYSSTINLYTYLYSNLINFEELYMT